MDGLIKLPMPSIFFPTKQKYDFISEDECSADHRSSPLSPLPYCTVSPLFPIFSLRLVVVLFSLCILSLFPTFSSPSSSSFFPVPSSFLLYSFSFLSSCCCCCSIISMNTNFILLLLFLLPPFPLSLFLPAPLFLLYPIFSLRLVVLLLLYTVSLLPTSHFPSPSPVFCHFLLQLPLFLSLSRFPFHISFFLSSYCCSSRCLYVLF